jgi:hypothetical protein
MDTLTMVILMVSLLVEAEGQEKPETPEELTIPQAVMAETV